MDISTIQFNKNRQNKVTHINNSLKKDSSKTIIEDIYVTDIILDKNNSTYNRHDNEEELQQLAESIRLGGLIDAIDVERIPNKTRKFQLLAGERRYLAVSKILGRKKIRAKIHENLSELERTIIINFSNLGQRNKKSAEDLFRAYSQVYEQLEHTDEETKKKASKLLGMSKRQMSHYKSILVNSTKEDYEAFKQGEISFSSLEEIAEYHRQVAKKHKAEEEAIKKYAETQENPSTKFYVNRDSHLLYTVEETVIHGKVYFGVKVDDYTTKLSPEWSRDYRLNFRESKEAMQVLLDSYALENNLDECDIEEYLELKKKKFEEKKKEQNKVSSLDDEYISNKSNVDDKFTEADYPTINFDNLPKVNEDVSSENIIENITENNKESYDANNKKSPAKDNQAENSNETEENNKKSDTNNKSNQLDVIKNEYAKNLKFTGEEIESNKKVIGQLLSIIEDGISHFYIIPDITKTYVEDEVPQEESGLTVYGLLCYAYEIIPETLQVLKE